MSHWTYVSHTCPNVDTLLLPLEDTLLTVLPIRMQGFDLHKRAFRDSLCLRYGWTPPSLQTSCACGSTFSIDHALNCPLGGFPSIRHDAFRDFTAKLMREVCHNTSVEPTLQPPTGENLILNTANSSNEARLDIKADCFWDCDQQTVFFISNLQSYITYQPYSIPPGQFSPTWTGEEKAVQRQCRQRRAWLFHPSCFLNCWWVWTGCTGRIQTPIRLICLQMEHWLQKVITWIRCKIGFTFIRSAVMRLRGTQSRRSHPLIDPDNVKLALTQGTTPI